MTREANRRAFLAVVSEDPGIKLRARFKFSQFGPLAIDALPGSTVRAIAKVFVDVGGIGELSSARMHAFSKSPLPDDLVQIDGKNFVVEYDEALHLTTYRRATLKSTLYRSLKVGFDRNAYLAACGMFRMPPGSKRAHVDPRPGVVDSTSPHLNFLCPTKPGECRHRQRAFYDFLKDVILGSGLRDYPGIIRISDCTDFQPRQTPEEIAKHGSSDQKRALCDLLRQRAKGAAR